jgi:hypothetical protein
LVFKEFETVIYRLKNQAEPERSLYLTGETWYNLIDLAELYGWTSIGMVSQDRWLDPPLPQAGYLLGAPLYTVSQEMEQEGLWILTEDALNLADALEQAFLEYEPRRVPDSYYLFKPTDRSLENRLSLGAITETIQFCRLGAFLVESLQRLQA